MDWALKGQPGTRLSLSYVTHMLSNLKKSGFAQYAAKFGKIVTKEGQVDIVSVP